MTERITPGLRSEVVRRSNLSTIIEAIHLDGVASRSDLVSHTGLTRSSVGALVGELVELGLVREERAASDGSPGRPSAVVRAEGERNAVLAIEILVDSVAVAAVGLGGTPLHTVRVDRRRDRMPLGQSLKDVARLVGQVAGALRSDASIHAVGVAIPGLVRRSDNVVVLAPNLGWRDVAIVDELRDVLGWSVPVAVGNEADLGALAESRRGVAAGMRNVLYVFGEVGIGGGVIADGRLLHGNDGFAGEVGHIQVNPDGRHCGCGAVGCWETEVGEEALLRRAGRPSGGGRTALAKLLSDASRGVPEVQAACAEQGRWLGIGLAGMTNLLNPQAVVLGGFLAAGFPHFITPLQQELAARAVAGPGSLCVIMPSALGADASLVGASEAAWDSVLVDPAAAAKQRVRAAVLA